MNEILLEFHSLIEKLEKHQAEYYKHSIRNYTHDNAYNREKIKFTIECIKQKLSKI